VTDTVATPGSAPAPPARSAADEAVRRLLVIPDRPAPVSEASVHRIFNISILLSATRCLLSYVVLPILLPFFGAASGIGPILGIPIAVVALTFDVMGIRRFWAANHRYRWAMTALYATVMAMVTALLVGDLVHLFG